MKVYVSKNSQFIQNNNNVRTLCSLLGGNNIDSTLSLFDFMSREHMGIEYVTDNNLPDYQTF